MKKLTKLNAEHFITEQLAKGECYILSEFIDNDAGVGNSENTNTMFSIIKTQIRKGEPDYEQYGGGFVFRRIRWNLKDRIEQLTFSMAGLREQHVWNYYLLTKEEAEPYLKEMLVASIEKANRAIK